MNFLKLTRINFVKQHPEMKKLRRSDPIQFDVLFGDWKRKKQNRIYNLLTRN